MTHTTPPTDILFVGGGLANTLAAWRLADVRPECRWRILEAGTHIGGAGSDRTWSFHAADLEGWARFGLASDGHWLRTLSSKEWPGYSVQFPRLDRSFVGSYCSIKSLDLHAKFVGRFKDRVSFGCAVSEVAPGHVRLGDGATVQASLVVDGRGFGPDVPYASAFQKFYGMNLSFATPHGLTEPLLMDARVPQTDGYRFFYLLPWSATELMVEDTYYSDTTTLDVDASAQAIREYVGKRFGAQFRVVGDERGVLPLPFAGADLPEAKDGVALSGVAAGRFHPTTGYSVAEAARFADRLARVPSLDAAAADRLNAESRAIWERGAFLRRLNNMMFRAGVPHDRWQIMERFYRRDAGLISRFYRGDVRRLDRLRILSGKPPVPVFQALKAFVQRIEPGRSALA